MQIEYRNIKIRKYIWNSTNKNSVKTVKLIIRKVSDQKQGEIIVYASEL